MYMSHKFTKKEIDSAIRELIIKIFLAEESYGHEKQTDDCDSLADNYFFRALKKSTKNENTEKTQRVLDQSLVQYKKHHAKNE